MSNRSTHITVPTVIFKIILLQTSTQLYFIIKVLEGEDWGSFDIARHSPTHTNKHWHPWPSLATSPYRTSLLAGLLGYIPYTHIAAACMFELVVLLLLGHMWGVHRSTSLMSSSLLPQQCLASLVRLTWIVFVMGGRRPYSWCLVGCCRQDLFNVALNILV